MDKSYLAFARLKSRSAALEAKRLNQIESSAASRAVPGTVPPQARLRRAWCIYLSRETTCPDDGASVNKHRQIVKLNSPFESCALPGRSQPDHLQRGTTVEMRITSSGPIRKGMPMIACRYGAFWPYYNPEVIPADPIRAITSGLPTIPPELRSTKSAHGRFSGQVHRCRTCQLLAPLDQSAGIGTVRLRAQLVVI